MSTIRVDVCRPPLALGPQWRALATGIATNVFMHPATVNVAHRTGFADLRVLLAWKRDGDAERLVGLWALQLRKLTPLGPALLEAAPHDYAFGSRPVVEPACADAVVAAFLDTLAECPDLPRVVRMRDIDGEGALHAALEQALAGRKAARLELAAAQRPFVTRQAGLKLSGSTRKKLRQDWNRLCTLGAVEVVNARDAAAVGAAFEVFLELEANSWKGERGTALRSRAADAAFARAWIGELAAHRSASVALLCLDGRPIAAQVLMYCGSMAYTWKIAFDGAFAKHSPGALLVDKVTEQLFAGDECDAIDSCSIETGFMAKLWAGRRRMLDLLVDVSGRRSLGFRLVAARAHAYARLRALRDRMNGLALPVRRGKRPPPAAGAAVARP